MITCNARSGVDIRLEVVDAFGDPVAGAILEPRSLATAKDGFAANGIRLCPTKLELFAFGLHIPTRTQWQSALALRLSLLSDEDM